MKRLTCIIPLLALYACGTSPVEGNRPLDLNAGGSSELDVDDLSADGGSSDNEADADETDVDETDESDSGSESDADDTTDDPEIVRSLRIFKNLITTVLSL